MDGGRTDRTDGGIAAKTPWVRYACRASASACAIGLLLILLLDGFGVRLPLVFGLFVIFLFVGGAFGFMLAKYIGLATGDTSVLDALLYTALFVVASCGTAYTAVTYNHAPRFHDSATQKTR